MPIAPGVISFEMISRYFCSSDLASSITIERRLDAANRDHTKHPPVRRKLAQQCSIDPPHGRMALAANPSLQPAATSILPGGLSTGRPCPRGCEREDARIDRSEERVGARQIAEAHQKLANDEAAGEAEILPEKAGPLVGRLRMV